MGSWLNLADRKCLTVAKVSGTFQLQLPAPHSLTIYPSSKNSAALQSSRKHTLHMAGRALWLLPSHRKVQSCSLHTLEKTRLLLCRTLPSTPVPQALHYKSVLEPRMSPPFFHFFSIICKQRYHLGFEVQLWDCMASLTITQLVLFSQTFYNAAFHPYHALDRCTAHDAGISAISMTGISMEITHLSLTIHITSAYSFFAFCCALQDIQSFR